MASLFAKLGAKAVAMASKQGPKLAKAAKSASPKITSVVQKAQKVASKAEEIGNVLEKASTVLNELPLVDTVDSVQSASPSVELTAPLDDVQITSTTVEPSGAIHVVKASSTSRFWLYFAVCIILTVAGTFTLAWLTTIGKNDKEKANKRNTLLLSSMLPILFIIVIGFGFYHIRYR